MNPRTFALTFLALFGLLLAPASGVVGASAPEFEEDEDHYVLQDAHVTVTFQNKTTRLHVAPSEGAAADANASYTLTLRSLAEHRDVDGDGVPSPAEAVAKLDLEGATDWNVTFDGDEETMVVNFTLVAPVTLGPSVTDGLTLPDRQAEVTLLFTLGAQPGALATELVVVSWPWLDAEAHRLVLDAHIDRELTLEEDAAGVAIVSNETTLGHLAWAPNATAEDASGEAFDVPVVAHASVQDNATRLAFVYDAPGVRTLAHEAGFGVAVAERVDETSNIPEMLRDVPSAGMLAALGALAAVALVRTRRS